jgi:hypothetical protein
MATMPALFVVSFAATYWMTAPVASTEQRQPLAVGPRANGLSADQPVVADPVSSLHAIETELDEPPPEPLPSLQDLVTDNDPATREEAQALVRLLTQEEGMD